jgi:hypothetical protein
MHLFLILLVVTTLALLGGLGLLSADTAGTATTVGRGEGEVNVLLGVETDDERRNVDDLLADADVALTDQDTGVVDGLGETELVDAGLEAALQEILNLQGKDVIELHAGLVEDTDTDQTANQGVALEETLGVLLVESEQLTGSTTDLGQSQTDTPDLTLVAQAILADELQLRVQSSSLERTARDTRGLGISAGRHLGLLLWCLAGVGTLVAIADSKMYVSCGGRNFAMICHVRLP